MSYSACIRISPEKNRKAAAIAKERQVNKTFVTMRHQRGLRSESLDTAGAKCGQTFEQKGEKKMSILIGLGLVFGVIGGSLGMAYGTVKLVEATEDL